LGWIIPHNWSISAGVAFVNSIIHLSISKDEVFLRDKKRHFLGGKSMIYHIVTSERWSAFAHKTEYVSETLDTETFVHCSRKEQVAGVLSRFYTGATGLLLMEIDESKLSSPLLYEPATDVADTFPHIYGPINHEAIINVTPIS